MPPVGAVPPVGPTMPVVERDAEVWLNHADEDSEELPGKLETVCPSVQEVVVGAARDEEQPP